MQCTKWWFRIPGINPRNGLNWADLERLIFFSLHDIIIYWWFFDVPQRLRVFYLKNNEIWQKYWNEKKNLCSSCRDPTHYSMSLHNSITEDALTWINAGTSILDSSSLMTVSWDSLIWDAVASLEIAKIWGLLGESSCLVEVMGLVMADIPVMGWMLLGKVYEHWYVDLPPRVRSSRIAIWMKMISLTILISVQIQKIIVHISSS